MNSQYDKLGEMLKDAIKTNNFPKKKIKEKNASITKKQENADIKVDFSERNYKTSKRTQKNNKNSNKKSNIIKKDVQKYVQLYKVFNLSYNCTLDELKNSYHELLKKYHPDNFNGMPETQKIAQRKTQELIKAYNELAKIVK